MSETSRELSITPSTRHSHLAHITPASLSCSRSATYTALSDMSSQCAWGLTSDESVNQSISQSVFCLISRPAWKTAKRLEKLRLTNRHLIRPRLGSGPHASRLLRPRIIIHSFSQLFHGPAPRSPLRRLSRRLREHREHTRTIRDQHEVPRQISKLSVSQSVSCYKFLLGFFARQGTIAPPSKLQAGRERRKIRLRETVQREIYN